MNLNLHPFQETLVNAFLRVGIYQNRSEIGRQAIEALLQATDKPKRLNLAIEVYKSGQATVSKAAEIAGIPFHEMHDILAKEQILQTPSATRAERARRAGKLASHIR